VTSRPGILAPALGILLILLGFASVAVFVWPEAPMEEPANPGKTPNPSKVISKFEEWMLYRWNRIRQVFRYAAIPAGVVCLVVGTMLLVPKRTRPS
jgi:hypothetical protein